MTQTPVNEFWWTWEPEATRVPIPRSLDEEAERWPRRRHQRESGGSWDERNSSMNLRRFPTRRCRFATNRIDWICMSREVMSWDRSKDDFLQWLVVPAPHTPAGGCSWPGYQWSWIWVESTNRLGIGASRQRNDEEWWILKPTVV